MNLDCGYGLCGVPLLRTVANDYPERASQRKLVCLHWTVSKNPILGQVGDCASNIYTRSGLFGLFTAGMVLSSFQLAMSNLTTIENLNRRSIVWTLAIRVPDHLLDRLWAAESPWAPTFRMVSYPPQPTPSATQPHTDNTTERHVFAILHTRPGENPFDLGSVSKNLQQVMGFSVADWLLPLKQSPCADHSSLESAFALGPVVTRLKQEAGLAPPLEDGRRS